MLSPLDMKRAQPLGAAAAKTVSNARRTITQILAGQDSRLLVVVGPCSIHDPLAATDYADRLSELSLELEDALFVVMRTYLEKPRSTVGWKGFISDPHMDGSCDVEAGLSRARELLHDINARGLPCATESLDPLLVPYTDDLVAWTALGARTAESQVHRAMASGLPMPVGVKNGTDGCVTTAVDGIEAIAGQHSYLACGDHGRMALTRSDGNPYTHVVLRGGRSGPNFDAQHVASSEAQLRARGMCTNLMVDCSHANANKQHERQLEVLADVQAQLEAGNRSLMGVMIESFLYPGNQPANRAANERSYGVSVTDPCLGWGQTQAALRSLRDTVRALGNRYEGRQQGLDLDRAVA